MKPAFSISCIVKPPIVRHEKNIVLHKFDSIFFDFRGSVNVSQNKKECFTMAKGESINVRVTLEEKNKLGARAHEAGLFTISDYVRQVLFVHDRGLDLRGGLTNAVKEMKAQGETMKGELAAARGELQAARETIEAGVLKMTEAGKAGNAEIMRTLEAFLEKCQDKKKSTRHPQEEKYIADPWLYPAGLVISFMFGIVFF